MCGTCCVLSSGTEDCCMKSVVDFPIISDEQCGVIPDVNMSSLTDKYQLEVSDTEPSSHNLKVLHNAPSKKSIPWNTECLSESSIPRNCVHYVRRRTIRWNDIIIQLAHISWFWHPNLHVGIAGKASRNGVESWIKTFLASVKPLSLTWEVYLQLLEC